MKKVGLVLLVLIFLVGCATYGNKEIANDETISQIKIGESTKTDVKQFVGEPSKVTFTDNGEEVWDYTYTRMKTRASTFIPIVGLATGGTDVDTQILTIRFGKNGVVKEMGKGRTTGSGGGLFN